MRKAMLFAILSLFSLALFAAQNRITLRDGKTYTGVFLSGNSRTIEFQDDSGERRRFNIDDVQTIEFNGPRETSANTANRSAPESGPGSLATLPAGSELAVRTNEAIDSTTATEGRSYSAVIDREVMDTSGKIAIPRGSDARLVILQLQEGGTTGSPNLVLDLESVSVNGQRYLVSTEDVERRSERGIGKNRRTAEMVGGGAALGTLLGAIAGGGKGAAIGAVAGAAARTTRLRSRGVQRRPP